MDKVGAGVIGKLGDPVTRVRNGEYCYQQSLKPGRHVESEDLEWGRRQQPPMAPHSG